MRRVLIAALAATAMGLAAATPAQAVTVVGPAATASTCLDFTFSGATETECAGGYVGNLIAGSLQPPGLAAIQALGYGGSGTYLSTLTFSGSSGTINFGTTLTGLTIIGLHYGSAGDGPEATSFFLFDAGAGTSSITVTGRDDTNPFYGLSNAALFSTGSVPEPATWAMMLVGFAGIGVAVRRSRKRNPALLQIA